MDRPARDRIRADARPGCEYVLPPTPPGPAGNDWRRPASLTPSAPRICAGAFGHPRWRRLRFVLLPFRCNAGRAAAPRLDRYGAVEALGDKRRGRHNRGAAGNDSPATGAVTTTSSEGFSSPPKAVHTSAKDRSSGAATPRSWARAGRVSANYPLMHVPRYSLETEEAQQQ